MVRFQFYIVFLFVHYFTECNFACIFSYVQEHAMKKRVDATYEGTRLYYEQLEQSLRKLGDDNSEENADSIKVTGKRTFGPVKRAHEEAN